MLISMIDVRGMQSAGLPTPVPPLVLGLIALAGSVTAFGVFRSTARD